MTLLCYDDVFLQHHTGNHPEQPQRLVATKKHLAQLELDSHCELPKWRPASDQQIARIHDLPYVQHIRDYARNGGGRIEADTVVSEASFDAAAKASGAVIHCVEQVVADRDNTALCLVRPPGHHARPKQPMGFCLFNHIAVGAKHATDALKLDRLLIVDWDVHHGNGTQESFYEIENIGFLSIHRWPFYPGSGSSAETGRGAGLGTTANVPMAFGTSPKDYRDALKRAVEAMAKKIKPQLILLSAGFDAHRLDPVGSLDLEVEDFVEMTQFLRNVAREYCDGKLVSMLEGGYNTDILPLCVEAHLRELLAA
jgi:acetoin utilization deacetylase AcuC-like enzyme